MKKILYFSAAWCGPCKTLAPIMEELNGEIVYNKVDVDKDQELSMKYGVRNIPTLILLNEFGEEINRKVGMQSRESILNLYNG